MALLRAEALYRTVWRTGFGRGYGPVVRQTAQWMNIFLCEVQQPAPANTRSYRAVNTPLLHCRGKPVNDVRAIIVVRYENRRKEKYILRQNVRGR